MKELSVRLTEEFGHGFSVSNLQLMRKLFIENKLRIQQQAIVKLVHPKKGATPSNLSTSPQIWQKATAKLTPKGIQQQAIVELGGLDISEQSIRKSPFTLSWTHYVLLLTIKDPNERSFYEIEATKEGWSVPELKRQKASGLYERLALSRDKAGIKRLANEGQIIMAP